MRLLFLCLIQLLSLLWLEAGPNISKPNCVDHCGNVIIPYPFGITAGCYHNTSYEIICNTSFQPPKPFLHQFNLEVLYIHLPDYISRRDPRYPDTYFNQILTVAIPLEKLCESEGSNKVVMKPVVQSYDFRSSPYRFSTWNNVFMVEGCGGGVVLKNKHEKIVAGCASVCDETVGDTNTEMTHCYGDGCCQASFPSEGSSGAFEWKAAEWEEGLDFYQIALDSKVKLSAKSCNTSAALIQGESVKKFARKFSNSKALPTVLTWRSGQGLSFPELDGSDCQTEYREPCICKFGYEGNPYLPNGCQVVEECHKCKNRCHLRPNFSPDSGYHYYCDKMALLKTPSVAGFSSGIGAVLLVLGCYWVYRFMKRRKEIKLKVKYFKRNGGLLLQQQMSSNEGVVDKTKIFNVSELEKATDNFNENRILGQGGQGTVYKGMLLDGRIVAIKKSKKIDESQVEPFINEVVILSQVNHRNVVRLLGCCLETEVPILVYEFIPNGTLYEHIHGVDNDFHVNWSMRLQIAAESAGALAYLHSSSSTPIYHRDIKSSNILLDEKYRAKVSDFGTSRAITIEQTHVTTCVLGTYGYLDPEYFQSNQFTEKSDVYSFGVVLAELLTGKKPICPTKSGGWISLATEFLTQMEDSRLFDILDIRISNEGKREEFTAVAELARRCLNMKGKQRPTMKEITVVLDGIRSHSPCMPNSKGLNPAEQNKVVREALKTHRRPFARSESSPEHHYPPWSIEVQPLMIRNLTN